MVDNFKEAKRQKERGMTNAKFLELVSEDLKDAEAIAVVALREDQTIVSYTTMDSSLQVLGLYEVAKAQTITDMEV